MSFELATVSLITQSDLHDYIRILTDAFRDDPLMEFIFPDEGCRSEQLEAFFSINLEFSRAAGEVYGTTSRQGCAIWLFPGDKSRARLSRMMVPAERLRSLFDNRSFERYTEFEQYMKEVHVGLQCPSYCLLLFLAVEQKQRRRGVGGRLVRPVLEYADEKRLPCVLDTMNEENLPFYHSLGFKVCREYRICGAGPYTWTMIRRPE